MKWQYAEYVGIPRDPEIATSRLAFRGTRERNKERERDGIYLVDFCHASQPTLRGIAGIHNAQCEHHVCLFGEAGRRGKAKASAEAGKLQSRRRITAGKTKRIIDASVLMASPVVYYERFSRCDANAGPESTPREKALRIYEPWIERAWYDRGFPAMIGW